MFNHGDQVVTNQKYFNQLGRRVYGTVIVHENMPKSEYAVLVRWDRQEGKIIPAHQDNLVVMRACDLENIRSK